MASTIPTVSIVGTSGSGKTTLIERVIPLLTERGIRVATVKHASHGHDVDRVGSDSWRHRFAGASAVVLAGASGDVVFLGGKPEEPGGAAARHHRPADASSLERITNLIERHLVDADVVLLEGFGALPGPRIVVRRRGIVGRTDIDDSDAALVVTDDPRGEPNEVTFDDVATVADVIRSVAMADWGSQR